MFIKAVESDVEPFNRANDENTVYFGMAKALCYKYVSLLCSHRRTDYIYIYFSSFTFSANLNIDI